ncbi:drug/metabolite transporter (DMT)-like permease [Nakamurella sp. UYEF19]|uniref:DMT family transporter n=1 Tax=Nakamurella sp. UYEF19 TaxID=1756392 RepID=UPI0033978786
MVIAVIAALTSAFCFALGAALQHREALVVPSAHVADVRLLWKLCRRPWWLAGTVADLGSMTLHIFALSLGTLALVQPLGVTGLVFAIPLAALLRRQRIRRLDIVAALAVVAGLITLLKTLPSNPTTALPSALSVIWMVAAVLGLVSALTLGAHFAPGRPRALLLAAAAGTAFGMTAVLVRTLLLASREPGSAPVVVAVSIAIALLGPYGYLLLQGAYRAGHFAASIAATTVLNPLVAVLAGGLLLHEKLPSGTSALVLIAAAAVVICGGVALLVRSPAILSLAPTEECPEHHAETEQAHVPAMAGARG